MPLILNIETSTEICSVALSQGQVILSLQESTGAYDHAAKITLLIEAALKEAGSQLQALDAIALSQGPGSYTALRIGASTAKGIGYALNKPLIAIDSLEALASASRQKTTEEVIFAPMIDARRMEVYTALFGNDLQRISATEAKIIDESSFEEYWGNDQLIVFSGNGAPKCQSVLSSPYAHFIDLKASAVHLVPLAVEAYENDAFVDLAYFSPHYFKAPNITKPKDIWQKKTHDK